MHYVVKIVARKPEPHWLYRVMFEFGTDEADVEIERFTTAVEAYGFCAWQNGGPAPALTEESWDRINAALPPEKEVLPPWEKEDEEDKIPF